MNFNKTTAYVSNLLCPYSRGKTVCLCRDNLPSQKTWACPDPLTPPLPWLAVLVSLGRPSQGKMTVRAPRRPAPGTRLGSGRQLAAGMGRRGGCSIAGGTIKCSSNIHCEITGLNSLGFSSIQPVIISCINRCRDKKKRHLKTSGPPNSVATPKPRRTKTSTEPPRKLKNSHNYVAKYVN